MSKCDYVGDNLLNAAESRVMVGYPGISIYSRDP
jgi:hypothetical protein